MGKRAGMLRVARQRDKPAAKPSTSAVKKHKLKRKLKQPAHLVPAVAAASAAAAADGLFGMALPFKSVATGAATSASVAQATAFEDDDKNALLQKLLTGGSSSGVGDGLIAADAHRAHMQNLKKKSTQKKGLPRYLRR